MSIAELFFVFAKVAMLTFGGGYAMVPLFQNEIVVRHALMSSEDFANLVALAQVTPGPIGFNAATYSGMVCGGLSGAASASLGVAAPTFLLALGVAAFLRRRAKDGWMRTMLQGIRPCVTGIIASAVVFFTDTSVFTAPVSSALKNGEFGVCWQGAAIFAVVALVRWKWNRLNPVWTLAGAAALGWILHL